MGAAYWLLHDSPEQAASTASAPVARTQEAPSETTAGPASDLAPTSAPPAATVAEGPPGSERRACAGRTDSAHRQPANYFASKPELARVFGLPSVVCRQSACEIEAIGYGPQAFATWSAATTDLRGQRWADELRAGGIYTTEIAPNEQGVVLILWRTRTVQRLRSVDLVLD